jgi:hypothetical protein
MPTIAVSILRNKATIRNKKLIVKRQRAKVMRSRGAGEKYWLLATEILLP